MRGGYREAGSSRRCPWSMATGSGLSRSSIAWAGSNRGVARSHKATLKTMVSGRGRGGARTPGPDGGQARRWARRTTGRSSPARCPRGSSSSTSTTPSSLKDAFDTAHGTDSPQFKKYRHLLAMSLTSTASFGRCSICARSLRATSESHRCWATCRGNRHRMGYADAKARGLPIGSGSPSWRPLQDLGHRTAQTLRHAMGAAWRAPF